ncbi:ImmA/IrrE family metallo-endopeptidase [Rhodococcus hoagii]|nr:ImmA/IrrE family metallo-endopeptidase [Prescottella equi]
MTLPSLSTPSAWGARENLRIAADYFVGQIGCPLDELSSEPEATLREYVDIQIRRTENLSAACPVLGLYRPSPPTIMLRPTGTWSRDNFTILHEYGHHLQQNDEYWAVDVLHPLGAVDRRRIEESVSDQFAAAVLLPRSVLEAHLSAGLTAVAVRDVCQNSSASRIATCVRSVELAPRTDHAIVCLTDLDATIIFSTTTDDSLARLPRGSFQPDLLPLIQEALEGGGTASGRAVQGLQYSTGNARADIDLEIAIDSRQYVFVIARPHSRYGRQQWGSTEVECASPACAEVFVVDGGISSCPTCGYPECPECSSCACERTVRTCSNCYLSLSAAEMAAGKVQHDDCW